MDCTVQLESLKLSAIASKLSPALYRRIISWSRSWYHNPAALYMYFGFIFD